MQLALLTLQHVAIDVIGQSEEYRRYVSSLVNNPKYDFDTNNQEFQNLYRDVVLKLKERGYLFDDDPEFVSILQTIKDLPPLESAVTQGNQLESINISTEDIIPSLHPASFNPTSLPFLFPLFFLLTPRLNSSPSWLSFFVFALTSRSTKRT